MKEKIPAVSVVVPVYNTAEFLDECITSLVNQTLRDIELIFVDDGSIDDSIKIIEGYQEQDSRIKIYKQKNQFAGVARNNGLAHASGKYIIFLDSDDFFDLHMLEDMYFLAEKSCAEIVYCGYNEFDNISKFVINKFAPQFSGLYKTNKIKDEIFGLNHAPWNKLILRQFVVETGMKYQEIRNTNDLCFNQLIVILSNQIYFIDTCFVFYRVNNVNSLQGEKCNYQPCYGQAFLETKNELCKRNLFDNNIKNGFYNKIIHSIPCWLSQCNSEFEMEVLFSHFRSYLPKILDIDIENYIKDEWVGAVLCAENFREFMSISSRILFSEYERLRLENYILKSTTISVDSTTFRVGRLFLFIPRALRTIFRTIFR